MRIFLMIVMASVISPTLKGMAKGRIPHGSVCKLYSGIHIKTKAVIQVIPKVSLREHFWRSLYITYAKTKL